MSQVSKYKIKSLFKRRVKVAKMIAVDLEQHTGWPRGPAKLRVEALLSGARFDVRAARDLGEAMTGARPARPSSVRVRWHPFSLIAMFEHAEAEYAAALMIDVLRTNGDVWRPASLAEVRNYLEVHTPSWMSNPFIRPSFGDLEQRGYLVKTGDDFAFTEAAIHKLAERSNRPGAATRKRGGWLLDALEGQPSECQRCNGVGDERVMIRANRSDIYFEGVGTELMDFGRKRCPDCDGSCHNNRGRLPRVEFDSPQLRRRYFDSGEGEEGRSWLRAVPSFDAGEGRMLTVNGPTKATRVVPRGEHRIDPCSTWAPWPGANAGDTNTYTWRCVPRWRRGELRHAKQRNAKQELVEPMSNELLDATEPAT